MSSVLICVAGGLTLLLVLVSFVQLLYLESLRLRSREQPPLEYFKNILEQKLGSEPERDALSFSLVKHSLMVVLGITVFGIAATGEALAWGPFAEATLIGLALMLGAAYLVPQLLYHHTNGSWLGRLAPALRLIALTARPLTATFVFLGKLATLNEDPAESEGNGNSTEDLDALIEAGADEGLIEEDDRKLIHSVVAFGDKMAREIMTPRKDVVAIPQEATIEDFRKLAINSHFSRIPVYVDSIDNITGFAHVRDILQVEDSERSRRRVKEFLHRTCFVPETKPVAEMFREMQRDSIHMAIVVDEYGETAGIATMEDVMEEVFGEIRDEYDPTGGVRKEAEGVFLLSGNQDLDQLDDLLDFRPDEDTESTTVGGLATEWLGHVPEVGETVERDGIRMEITEGDERHVEQVRVSRAPVKETEEVEGEDAERE